MNWLQSFCLWNCFSQFVATVEQHGARRSPFTSEHWALLFSLCCVNNLGSRLHVCCSNCMNNFCQNQRVSLTCTHSLWLLLLHPKFPFGIWSECHQTLQVMHSNRLQHSENTTCSGGKFGVMNGNSLSLHLASSLLRYHTIEREPFSRHFAVTWWRSCQTALWRSLPATKRRKLNEWRGFEINMHRGNV